MVDLGEGLTAETYGARVCIAFFLLLSLLPGTRIPGVDHTSVLLIYYMLEMVKNVHYSFVKPYVES